MSQPVTKHFGEKVGRGFLGIFVVSQAHHVAAMHPVWSTTLRRSALRLFRWP